MLNIRLYSGVPFQRSYNNVIKFNNQSELNSYLETYLQGTINNIAQFFDGNNEIVLSDLYENCNYMFINDTNSTTPNKYYFIENYEFISGGGVKYHLILDIWATYNYNIVLKPSLCTRGHCDALNIPQYKVNSGNIKSNKILDYYDANNITNRFVIPSKDFIDGTILAIVNVEGNNYNNIYFLYYKISGVDADAKRYDLSGALSKLCANKFNYIGAQNDTNYQVIKCYFIPQDIEEVFKTMIPSNMPASSVISFGDSVQISGDTWTLFQGDFIYVDGNNVQHNSILHTFTSGVIFDEYIYKNNLTRKDFEGKRVLIGALDNYREIDATGLTNYNDKMQLKLYYLNCKQIEIMFECNNIKINLTSSFEIPYINDEYILYLNQNQNQIDVANKQNAINLSMSLASIGAGVMLAGFTGGASLGMSAFGIANAVKGAVMTEESKNSALNDMKNKFDRLDGINNNCSVAFGCGVGAFTVDDNDNNTIDIYERFGNETQYYINNIYPSDLTRYNYIYVKFENVSLTGNFNENVRNIFETIFNKGVRIWFNASQFLNSMTHESS